MNVLLKKGYRGEEVKLLQKALHLYEDGIFGRITEDAVKAFQRANGLKVDGIVGNQTWSKLDFKEEKNASSLVLKKSRRRIDEIIVHCSATPEGRNNTVDDLRAWHKAQGWSDIGYHYVVYIDGSIHVGRDVDIVGAHCSKGGHNTYSIGVCYIGGEDGMLNAKGQIVAKLDKNGRAIDKDTRTWEQKESLIYLLKELRKMYPKAVIVGHHDYDKGKSCPVFNAKEEYKDI